MNLTPTPRNPNLPDMNENSIPADHEEKKLYKCSSCNAAFSRKCYLNRHVSGVHENKKTYQCGICLVKFLEEHELKRHIFEVHENKGEKLYRFTRSNARSLSNAALSQKIILDNHESGAHERPKNVKLTKSQSKSHEIIYAGEKKFACKFCEKRFTKLQLVKYHELIHTGEKPYACKYCEKRFIQPNSLKRHELIHAGEKPYSCKTCAYRCRERSNLKKHEILLTAGKRVRNHLPASSVM